MKKQIEWISMSDKLTKIDSINNLLKKRWYRTTISFSTKSNSEYLEVFNPCSDEWESFEIRFSDHELPWKYGFLDSDFNIWRYRNLETQRSDNSRWLFQKIEEKIWIPKEIKVKTFNIEWNKKKLEALNTSFKNIWFDWSIQTSDEQIILSTVLKPPYVLKEEFSNYLYESLKTFWFKDVLVEWKRIPWLLKWVPEDVNLEKFIKNLIR